MLLYFLRMQKLMKITFIATQITTYQHERPNKRTRRYIQKKLTLLKYEIKSIQVSIRNKREL